MSDVEYVLHRPIYASNEGRTLQQIHRTVQVIENKVIEKEYTDEYKYFNPLVDGLSDVEHNTSLTNRTLLRVVKCLEANKFVLPDISDEEIEPFCKKGDKCTWHKGQQKRHEEGQSEHDEDEGESEHDEEQRESREHDSEAPAKRQQELSCTNLGDEDDTNSKANGTVPRSNRKSKTNKEDEYSYYEHEKRQLRGLKETLQWVNRQDDKTPLAQIAEITLKKSSLHSLTANKLPDNNARYVDSLAIDAGIYINRPPEGEFDIRDSKKNLCREHN